MIAPDLRANLFTPIVEVQYGQIWQIGKHRIMCGDSTNIQDVARLMQGEKANAIVTDPPYATLGGGTSIAGKNIEVAFDRQFFRVWFHHCLDNCFTPFVADASSCWFTIDWRGATSVEEAVVGTGWKFTALGIWVRGGLGMGYALRKTHEHFVLLTRDGWQRTKTDEPDVWEYLWTPGHRKNQHQAEKPIPLMERAIELCGGDLIFDPFVGSATTIIASQNLGKRCFGMDMSPEYCSIAIQRWQEMTCEKAVLAS